MKADSRHDHCPHISSFIKSAAMWNSVHYTGRCCAELLQVYQENSSETLTEKLQENNSETLTKKLQENSETSTKKLQENNSETSTKKLQENNSETSTEKLQENSETLTEKLQENSETSTKKLQENSETSTKKLQENHNKTEVSFPPIIRAVESHLEQLTEHLTEEEQKVRNSKKKTKTKKHLEGKSKEKFNMSLKISTMNIFVTLILFEVISSTEEVLHHREKRGTRTFKSVCIERSSGRVFRGDDTWLRSAGRRVEFCRCENGKSKCHSVPVMDCTETKCYNGGRCRQALYSSNHLCLCLNGFSGENCEIDTRTTCYQGSGESYRGNHSRTVSGAVCVNWNSPGLNGKRYTTQNREALQFGLGNHNFCRNPDGEVSPWCYVFKDGAYNWEHCRVPSCPVDIPDCYSERGTSYRGSGSVTISGARCLRWDSALVKNKVFNAWSGKSRSQGLGSHNYCRNPDNDVRPWCHVMNGTQAGWEFCDVPKCSTCGIRNPPPALQPRFRIAGGRGAQITSHPWMAALFHVYRRSELFFCGGTLIDHCWVLTAAHCLSSNKLSANKIRVKLGRTMRAVPGVQEQSFRVEKIYKHPQFDEDTFDNDIALLKLQSTSGSCAMETDNARPACMPERGQKLQDWTECEISGYGRQEEFSPFYSDQLKEGHVRLYPENMCTPKQLDDRTVTSNMLCAGDTRNQDDACQGDSGGPLVCLTNGRMHLFGIVSWGEGCGRKGKPGVYTKVTQYLDWIEHHTGLRMY